MGLQIGDIAPDFQAHTTEGLISFHEWIGDAWCVLLLHQKDLSPISATGLGDLAEIKSEFEKRNVKIVGLTIGPVMVGDRALLIAKAWRMRPASGPGDAVPRGDNETERNVCVIGPDKKIKLALVYPTTTGRNFHEVLRIIDSLQLTDRPKTVAPEQRRWGDGAIIAGQVSNEEAETMSPFGWIAPRPSGHIVLQSKT